LPNRDRLPNKVNAAARTAGVGWWEGRSESGGEGGRGEGRGRGGGSGGRGECGGEGGVVGGGVLRMCGVNLLNV